VELKQRLKEQRIRSLEKFNEEDKATLFADTKWMKEQDFAKNSLQVGQKAPAFALSNAEGNRLDSRNVYPKGYTILSFYRGSWCPYCVMELQAYQEQWEAFQAKGVKVIAISFENPSATRTLKQHLDLSFEFLYDENQEVAHAFGIVFAVSPGIVALYARMGMDLMDANQRYHGRLPLPATYLIDPSGTIVYAFADVDYTRRADPKELLNLIP
jgi:peroxiredoxin